MFTDVFIRRPILATVCSLLITLAGAISIPNLPIGRYPELAPPSVSVGAFYTGANAVAVESAVTTPLESVINGAQGMTYIFSAWWIPVMPAAAVALIAIVANFAGDALRDRIRDR